MKVPLQWGCMERLIHFVEISFVRVVFFLYDRERNQTNPRLSFLVSRVIVMDFRVSYITIRIDALSISVSVQLWHVRYHISSTLFRGQSISWDHQAVSWCGTYATVSIRFLGEEGCLSEENWDVYVPMQGIDEGLSAPSVRRSDWSWYGIESCRSSWRTWKKNFIQKIRYNLFVRRNESIPWLGIVVTTSWVNWGQDGRYRTRFRSHLQDEISRSQSKLQGRRC